MTSKEIAQQFVAMINSSPKTFGIRKKDSTLFRIVETKTNLGIKLDLMFNDSPIYFSLTDTDEDAYQNFIDTVFEYGCRYLIEAKKNHKTND